MKKNKIVEAVKWVWMVLVVVAGTWYVVKNFHSSLDYLLSIKIVGILLSVFFLVLTRLLNIDLIRESVREVGWKSKFSEMFSLISITQLGKYIPGGVWQFAARFGTYKENKLSYKAMAKAFFMENIWMVGGGIFCGLFFLLLGNPDHLLSLIGVHFSNDVNFFLALVCVLLWLISIFLFQKVFLKDSIRHAAPRTIRLVAGQALMYITLGISFFFLFASWDVHRLLYTIGAYTISFIAGYVAIFAPGGIGVREVVSIALFTGVAASSELAAIAIVHRLLYTLVDFILGLIGFIMSRRVIPTKDKDLDLSEVSQDSDNTFSGI